MARKKRKKEGRREGGKEGGKEGRKEGRKEERKEERKKKKKKEKATPKPGLAVLSPYAFQTWIHSLASFRPSVSKISSLCLSIKECSWAPPTSDTENNSHCHHLFFEMKPYIGRLNLWFGQGAKSMPQLPQLPGVSNSQPMNVA